MGATLWEARLCEVRVAVSEATGRGRSSGQCSRREERMEAGKGAIMSSLWTFCWPITGAEYASKWICVFYVCSVQSV